MPGHFGQDRLDLVVRHVRQGLDVETTVDEPLRQCPQCLTLAGGDAAGAQDVRIRGEQFGGSWQLSSEVLLETGHDCPRRADRELLAGDLEDQRPEGIERRELVEPSPRAEVRVRIDDPREHRVGLAKKRPRLGSASGCSWSRHSSSRRSVSTIWTTSATVSWRAQSRCSSHGEGHPADGLPASLRHTLQTGTMSLDGRPGDGVNHGIHLVALPQRVERRERHADLGPERTQD